MLLRERVVLRENAFADLRVWRVPTSVRGSRHPFKYALAYIVLGTCVLRYDNEARKGDHRHLGDEEQPYEFTTAQQLLNDFWSDVENWRPE